VLTPSLCCSFLAIARPTAPPPMTACVKSACLVAVVEKQRDWRSAFAPLRQNIVRERSKQVLPLYVPRELADEWSNIKPKKEINCVVFKGLKDQQLLKDKSGNFHPDDSPYRVAKHNIEISPTIVDRH
jgi:hypothetical protein